LNQYNIETQYASAIAATDGTKVGFSAYDNRYFTVDATGYVSATAALTTDLHTARFIVGDLTKGANYTTIASAITAASAGDIIYIQNGTYTENLTLKNGIILVSWDYSRSGYNSATTIIKGKCSLSSGYALFQGLEIRTNGDYALAMTGNGNIQLLNCNVIAADFTPIRLNNGLANIMLTNSNVDLATTGIGLYNIDTGNLWFYNCIISNSGLSTTASVNSNSVVWMFGTQCAPRLDVTGTGYVNIIQSYLNTSDINIACLTTAGTSTSSIKESWLVSGTASAVSIGSGTIVECTQCVINSSNTNAITGAGTLTGGNLTFVGSSSLINTTTQTFAYTQIGKWKATSQPCVSAYVSANVSNVTGDNTIYQVIFDTVTFDQNSNYNNSTGTFTAPVAGRYLVCGQVASSNSVGGLNAGVQIVATGKTYNASSLGSAALGGNNWYYLPFSQIINMAASDTVAIKYAVYAGTKTAAVIGGSSPTTYVSFMQVA
jgi:hypothetical protein